MHACCSKTTNGRSSVVRHLCRYTVANRYVYVCRVPSYYFSFSLSDSYFWLKATKVKAPEKALAQGPCKAKVP